MFYLTELYMYSISAVAIILLILLFIKKERIRSVITVVLIACFAIFQLFYFAQTQYNLPIRYTYEYSRIHELAKEIVPSGNYTIREVADIDINGIDAAGYAERGNPHKITIKDNLSYFHFHETVIHELFHVRDYENNTYHEEHEISLMTYLFWLEHDENIAAYCLDKNNYLPEGHKYKWRNMYEQL